MTGRPRLAHWAFAVPCPQCRALFGQPCRSRRGRGMSNRVHEVREWLALAEHEPEGDE